MSFLIEEEALKEIARMDWRFGQLRRQLLADKDTNEDKDKEEDGDEEIRG